MFQDFAVLDEGNISDAQLLRLPLLCFRNLCLFAQAHHPEMGAARKFAHCLAKFCGF